MNTLDLRDLAGELRKELADCTTSCTECDGEGVVETTVHEEGDDAEIVEVYCAVCGGEGEVFDVSLADEAEITALVELANELSGSVHDETTREGIDAAADELDSIGSNYEPTLIREDEFTEYAQQLAEEIGALPEDNSWPAYCIDWEWAARELRVDYMTVDYAGTTYLIRSW